MDPRSTPQPRQDDLTLLEAAVWAAELGAYEWDMSADRNRWLNNWCQHHDIDPCEGEQHGVRWRANVHPDDRAAARVEWDAHLAGERDRYESEYRMRTLGGVWRWVRNRAVVVRGPNPGDPMRLIGVCLNINERRELAVELERSRRSLEALAAAAPIWMMLLDAEGIIEFASRSFLGVSPAALLGRSIGAVIGEATDAAAIDAFRQSVLRAPGPQMHTAVLRDGRSIGTWARRIEQDGKVTGIASVSVDLSERRTRERDLLEAVTREQRRFGRDLHDGLGQELTGIALLVKTLVKRAEKEAPALCAELIEVLDYVSGAIATSREVARGASPVGREHGGLGRALIELARRWPTEGNLQVECRVDGRAGDLLEPLVAENLYRIAQESINNAVRHSGARHIGIVLAHGASPTGVHLTIEDDGSGIPSEQMFADGLGLRIMRARAELVGAVLRVGDRSPKGTLIECRWEWRAGTTPREPGAAPTPA